ncbi:RluA family pseudouridine synthase [Pseudalkalibacillus caeni]|uniref:Pseudouridine synthase n=1 Tax=Exobacillus caeni TaxID=2574798 RepID=A0A5R9F458_9BACL|nr:RluA family pseudouridine synthase [Pseudalkalibacillus caeni]TLS37791.1 RluA family pseudouridine synthase [Pseudalkalibacillus caeni]
MERFSIHWTIDSNHSGMVLRDFLIREKQVSRSALTDIKFSGGALLVNNKAVTVREVLAEGDSVTVIFPAESASGSMKAVEQGLSIIYEDEHILLLNKPPYLPTIPSRHSKTSLAQGVLYYYKTKKIDRTIHVVNRLDRDTSGIVLIAKHRYAHDLLARQQKKQEINRLYRAVVHGYMNESTGRIDRPIGRKENSIIERCVREDGQRAATNYEVIKRAKDCSYLSLWLETGRTHQIRVHLSSIHHPLVGDDLYGGKMDKIKRQALHSYKISFFHPFTGEKMTFKASFPEDMSNLIDKNFDSIE